MWGFFINLFNKFGLSSRFCTRYSSSASNMFLFYKTKLIFFWEEGQPTNDTLKK